MPSQDIRGAHSWRCTRGNWLGLRAGMRRAWASLDRSDQDFLYTILGRDKHGRFRAVDVEINIATNVEAQTRLETALAHAAMQPPGACYQHDETGAPLDFFTPLGPEAKQHPIFRQIITGSHKLPSF